MNWGRWAFILLSLTCLGLWPLAQAEAQALPSLGNQPQLKAPGLPEVAPLQATAVLKPDELEPEQIVEVEIKIKLLPGYKAYEDQFRLTADPDSGFQVSKYSLSPITEFYDDFSKKNRRGLIGDGEMMAAIGIPAKLRGHGTLKLHLTYQACTKSFCLFPKTLPLEVSYKLKGYDKIKSPLAMAMGKNPLFDGNLVWTFLAVFLAGLLTSFTPCIFPMIPITLAVLSKDAHLRTRRQSFLRSLAYVLGIAITYSILGLLAASTGALFGSAMSSPWVLGSICAVFLAMSLSLFGFYDLEAPRWLQDRMHRRGQVPGPLGAFLTGMVSGVVASPCVGPILVGILAYVAQTQDLLLGFGLLFTFALGMGQIFLLLGAFTSLTKKLPRSGPWLHLTKQISGLLMLGVFYYFLSLLLPLRWFDGALALGLILLGSLGGAFLKELPAHGVRGILARLQKGFGWSAIIFGSILLAIAIFDLRPRLSTTSLSGMPGVENSTAMSLAWQPLTDQTLKTALEEKKPVLIDFFAEWCAACHELDKITFVDARVAELLKKNFVLLRFDATKDSAELTRFRQRYGILGLPWVVFIDQNGKERKDLTLTEFEEPVHFSARLRRLLE